MKGFILDSTFKESSIIDNNNDISTVSSHSLLNNTIKTYNMPLNENISSYISHHNNSNKFNIYNIIDYI